MQSWSGVRQAIQFGVPALQGETFTPRSAQSEDCLFLNIWTPTDATADSKLPVLFWIHGGAFIQGSGAQPALRWTRENITAFGGDPGNITISGSSAGGTSCLFLMVIPQTQGLFHKAIIHGSGGIQNIQTLSEAEAAGLRLSERLGLGSIACDKCGLA